MPRRWPKNLERITVQLEKLLDFSAGPHQARLVNNYTWTSQVGLLDFLRDTGKHVTVNQMVARESVKARMESDTGISYTEFTYQLLQAADFCWLYEHEQCEMQMGGSDQWGNIVTGIDLIRKRVGGSGVRAHLAAAAQGRRHEVREVGRAARCGSIRTARARTSSASSSCRSTTPTSSASCSGSPCCPCRRSRR